MKRTRLTIALLGWVAFGSSTALAKEPDTIQILLGQQKVLLAPQMTGVEVSNPDAIKVVEIGRSQVLVIAMHPGESTLVVKRKAGPPRKYQVSVTVPERANQALVGE